MELTGEQPTLKFGDPDSPTCELYLDRAASRLTSTCAISQASGDGRRLALGNDDASVQTQLDTLKAELATIRSLVEALK